jgi:signal transduction histidine kinase
VAKLARDGRGTDAAVQLDRLGHVVREAHADLREHILNLRSAPSLEKPFFTVVEQYLDGFTHCYDIHTQLTIEPGLGEQPFSPDAQLQVFRILQEALSNARKHGQARQVQVVFAGGDGRACLFITDDGRGFDPDSVVMAGDHHYGLQFMQERAAQLGGTLQVSSAPCKGTQVVLEIPTNADRPDNPYPALLNKER